MSMKNLFYENQAKLVKMWGNVTRIIWGEDEEKLFYSTDGSVGYLIPKEHLLLNTAKLAEKSPPVEAFQRFLGDDSAYTDGFFTGTENCSGTTLAVIEDSTTKVYLDYKMLKPFQSCEPLFRIKSDIDCVRVYWEGGLCAIIMPINRRKYDRG